VQTKGFKIGLESFYKVKDELEGLLRGHWEVSGTYKDNLELNPDWEYYQTLYDKDNLGLYCVRDKDQLVGYLVVVVRTHPHYKNHVVAYTDLVFIKPEQRKGLLGYKLIKYAEEDLKEKGVSVFSMSTKQDKPFNKLLERRNFELQESLYTKYLQGE